MGERQVDEQGNTTEQVLALERKSVKPFRDQDEYLYAMKEDLAEWFNTLYDTSIDVDTFFENIETGVLLCQHANKVQDFIMESMKQGNGPKKDHSVNLPPNGVPYRKSVKPLTFQSRDNISNFISWCRGLGIHDCLLFETEDLVLRKNERSVILCLLEVARRGARYGMLAPVLIQLEQEIDADIQGKEPPKRVDPPKQIITVDLMSLDEMVRHIVSQCSCPAQFPMVQVAEGKYRIGESQTLIYVRILRNHVMVRVGGGWDTLEHFLDKHDPCRCQHTGHRGSRSTVSSAAKRRSSAPSAQLAGLETKGRPEQTTGGTPVDQRQKSPRSQQVPSSQGMKRSQSLVPGATDGQKSQKKSNAKLLELNRNYQSFSGEPNGAIPKRHSSAIRTTKSGNTSPTESDKGKTLGALHKNFHSATDLNDQNDMSVKNSGGSKNSGMSESSSTPQSKGTTTNRARKLANPGSRDTSRDIQRHEKSPEKKRVRSRSVGVTESSRQNLSLSKTAPVGGINNNSKRNGQEMLIVSRDKSGRHKVSPVSPPPQSESSRGGPRELSRSHTFDLGNEEPKEVPRVRKLSLTSTLTLASNFEDYPEPPPENKDLYIEMEKLFEEYRRWELGLAAEDEKLLSTADRTLSRSGDLLESSGSGASAQRIKKAKSVSREDLLDDSTSSSKGNSATTVTRNTSRDNLFSTRSASPSLSRRTAIANQRVVQTPVRAIHSSGNSTPQSTQSRNTTPQSTQSNSPALARRQRSLSRENILDSKGIMPTPARLRKSTENLLDNSRASPVLPRKQRSTSRDNILGAGPKTSTPATKRPSSAKAARSRSSDNLLDDDLPAPRSPSVWRRQQSVSKENLLTDSSSPPRSKTPSPKKTPATSAPPCRPQSAKASVGRSSSQTRVHISPRSKPRSRSREDLLDESPRPMRRQRSQSTTSLANTQNVEFSVYKDEQAQRPSNLDLRVVHFRSKPRKDDKWGERTTKIPMPVSDVKRIKGINSPPLRRVDSGVDITNMSPTEASLQGDDDLSWQRQQEAVGLMSQPLSCQTSPTSHGHQDYF